jgi:hypothetical protein
MRGATQRRRRHHLATLVVVSLLCVLAVLASSGTAAADSSPPEWGNATVERTDPTRVNVTFYDNERINRETIGASDFRLSSRNVTQIESIRSISAEGNRSGVAVTLTLDGPLTDDNATLGFQPTGSIIETPNSDGSGEAGIADDAGNALTSGSVTVTFVGSDTGAPQWGTATRAEPTEINVTFYDNVRVDPTSIDANDFSLSSGSVANITRVRQLDAGENRSGVYVHLLLEERVDADNVTVSFGAGGSVADTDGNELTNGSVTASGMDTVVPDYERFTVERVNASTAEVRLETNERLAGIDLRVWGPADSELGRANFTETVGETAVYTTQYTVPEDGTYRFEWIRATDRSGNFLRLSQNRQFEYDDGVPDVVLTGPENTTVGTTVNFSAAETVDEDDIESYQWRIDGGTILTGESIQVAFAVAGSHEVVVEATDAEGNTGVATRQIQVRPANTSAVTLTRANATHASATVDGTGFVQQVRAADGPVISRPNVSLDRLSAAFPEGETTELTFRADEATPSSFGPVGLGHFEIAHGNTTAQRVSVRFGVNRTALNRTGGGPDDVALYRLEDNWSALETSVVTAGPDRMRYQADSPGLSEFAVGVTPPAQQSTTDGNGTNETESSNETESNDETAPSNETSQNETAQNDTQPAPTPTGAADIVVSNVTVNESSPAPGDTVSINVTARNRGTAVGAKNVTVALNNTTLSTHRMSVRPGATRTQQFVHELPEEGALTVDSRRVANVTSGGGLLSMLPGSVAGALSGLPNPLALWPGGIVGTVLGALVGLVVVTYAILKALAIYLGY